MFGYAYNLSGALIEETYPSGRVVKNMLNSDGELSQVQSGKCLSATLGTSGTCSNRAGLFPYADSFNYNTSGAVTAMQLGNGHWETAAYNERQQISRIGLGLTATDQNLLKLEFKYNTTGQSDNNGLIREQKITVPTVGANPGFTATQTFSYDSLNRIQSAKEMGRWGPVLDKTTKALMIADGIIIAAPLVADAGVSLLARAAVDKAMQAALERAAVNPRIYAQLQQQFARNGSRSIFKALRGAEK